MFVAALCAASVLGTLVPASAAAAEFVRPTSSAPRVPGEVVVRFDPNFPSASRATARAAVDGRRAASLGVPGLELVELDGTSVADAVEELEARPDVLYAEPNYIVTASATPSDPLFSSQWGLHEPVADVDIDAPEAWDIATGTDDVVVAIVDTGVAWDHPDLVANMWTNPGESGGKAANGIDDDGNGLIDDVRGWDWADNDNNPMDVSGHGTHVAGTIAASGNNGLGISGVAWDAKLLPLRVLNGSGSGGSADVARAFSYAASAGADVVNASFGSFGYSQAVSDVVAGNPDVAFVAAAGNDAANNDHEPQWPCNLTHANVICVTAMTRDGAKSGFANVGPTSVDIAAPGQSILSTIPNRRSLLVENFAYDISSGWATGGTSSWGPVQGPTGTAYSDSPSGPALANGDSWLATRYPIDTSAASACALTYDLNLDTIRPDALYIEVSRDGSAWERIKAYSGTTGGRWSSLGVDLETSAPQLYLRFRLVTDGTHSSEGAGLDNVVVRCAMNYYDGNEYAYSSGTSMAAPHVSGAAALVAAADPSATAATIRTVLFQTADPAPAFAGVTVTGARLNAGAALMHVAGTSVSAPDHDPEPTPAPTSEPDPVPVVDPTETPLPDTNVSPPPEQEVLDHERAVTARLVRRARLRGKVLIDDGYSACIAGVRVVIRRNGRFLKAVTTNARGGYKVRVPRRGRYLAVAKRFVPDDAHLCLKARSSSVR